MENDHYIGLMYKQLVGEITSDESALLRQWRQSDPMHDQLCAELAELWALSEPLATHAAAVSDADIETAYQEVLAKKEVRTGPDPARRIVPVKWLSIAAGFLVVAVAVFAMIRVAGQDARISVTAERSNQVIRLPDGSEIGLDKGAELSYNQSFGSTNRQLSFTGSGFFDIAENASLPFVVRTGQGQVTVLGTRFYIATGQEMTVHVKSGSVQLSTLDDSQSVQITPGEKYALRQDTFKLISSDQDRFDWHVRTFDFNDSRLDQVIPMLENWFDAELEITGPMRSCRLTATFTSQDKISEIMETIATVYDAELQRVNQNSFLIKGEACE